MRKAIALLALALTAGCETLEEQEERQFHYAYSQIETEVLESASPEI